MFRVSTALIASAAVMTVAGLAACGNDAGGSASDTTTAPVGSAAPAAKTPQLGEPGAGACADGQFEVATVRDIQHGTYPGDARGAAQRIALFAQAAPAEIRQAAKGAAGPAILVMRQHDMQGMESTDAVNHDLGALADWLASHC
jgi:hypothetical protein